MTLSPLCSGKELFPHLDFWTLSAEIEENFINYLQMDARSNEYYEFGRRNVLESTIFTEKYHNFRREREFLRSASAFDV